MAQGPPARVFRARLAQRGRLDELDEVGVRHSGQGRHAMGGRLLQDQYGFFRRVPCQATSMPVHACHLPPQRLPIRAHMSINFEVSMRTAVFLSLRGPGYACSLEMNSSVMLCVVLQVRNA